MHGFQIAPWNDQTDKSFTTITLNDAPVLIVEVIHVSAKQHFAQIRHPTQSLILGSTNSFFGQVDYVHKRIAIDRAKEFLNDAIKALT